MKYHIWSFEHDAWWKANWAGYTEDIKEAGVYGLEEATQICTQANMFLSEGQINEALVPVNYGSE